MGARSDTRRGPIGSLSLDRGKSSAARLSPCAPFPRRRTSGPIASHRVEVAPPIGGRHDRYLGCSPDAALRPEPPALLSALCSLLEQERISLRFVCERHLIRLRSPPRKVHRFRAFKVRNRNIYTSHEAPRLKDRPRLVKDHGQVEPVFGAGDLRELSVLCGR